LFCSRLAVLGTARIASHHRKTSRSHLLAPVYVVFTLPNASFKPTKLSSLLSILQHLDEVQRGMPVGFLKTLLLVGIDEGQPAAEYADEPAPIDSRWPAVLKTLGAYNVWRKCDGFGYLKETKDKRGGNQKAIFLTAAGRRFLKQISDILECGKTSNAPLTREPGACD
jgi:hypothetical protein